MPVRILKKIQVFFAHFPRILRFWSWYC